MTWQEWINLFIMDRPFLEIFTRGTAAYLGIFVMLRVVMKREAAGLSITDLLVVVMLADAAQNGMAGDYKSISDGLLLVGVIIFWSFALDWLAYRFGFFQKLVYPPKLLMVKNGKIMKANMKKEFLSEEELMSQLRMNGIEDIKDVKQSYMESDGHLSFITFKNAKIHRSTHLQDRHF